MFKNQIYYANRSRRFDAKASGIDGKLGDRSDAELCNISIGGASFMLREPMEIRSSCTVEILAGSEKLQISGRVAWSRNPGEKNLENQSREGMYTVGVVFINTYHNEVGSRLSDILNNLGTPHTEEIR